MSVADICRWLENSSIGLLIGQDAWLFPGLEAFHVVALALVMGSIAVVDLRLLGFAASRISVKQLTKEMLPYTWVAFAGAVITGGLLFISNATTYYDNIYFRIKIILLLFAGINMLIFHLRHYKRVETWGGNAVPPPTAKVAGGISLMLWVGVVICGRLIGFFGF